MKTILALYLAQAREFLRDRTSFFFVLLLPVALGVFFGLIFSGGGAFKLELGLVNEDAGPAGAAFVQGLQDAEPSGAIRVHTGTREEMLDQMNKGTLHVVLVLPADMTAALAAGEAARVAVYYDPVRPNSAGLGLGMVRTLLNEANLAMLGAAPKLVLDEQAMQTHPLRSVDFYLPGMLGVALLWLGVFGTAAPVVAQRTAQIVRRFRVTPVTPAAMLVAEVSWRVSVGLLQAALFLIVGAVAFGVGVQAWLPFAAAVLLGSLCFVTMGYVLAGLSRTADGAMAVAQIVNFPMMMLSGSFLQAEMLPAAFKPIMNVLPLTYLSDIFRQTMAGIPGTYDLGLDFAVVGVWFVVFVVAAVKLWRWE